MPHEVTCLRVSNVNSPVPMPGMNQSGLGFVFGLGFDGGLGLVQAVDQSVQSLQERLDQRRLIAIA